MILFPLFAPSINNTIGTGGKKFGADFVDTGGKFSAGVIDTGSNFALMSLIPVANLPMVSLILVVHLDLRISPRISKNLEITLVLFSGAWGMMIHEKI